MQEKQNEFDWQGVYQKLADIDEMLSLGKVDKQAIQILDKRKKLYQKKQEEEQRDQREMVVFHRDASVYAIPIEELAEIRVMNRLTSLPLISNTIQGLINIRGNIVAVHDLAAFDGNKHDLSEEFWVLIGYGKAASMALLADSVEGISLFSREEIREIPVSMHNRKDCFLGIGADGTMFLKMAGLIKNSEFFHA